MKLKVFILLITLSVFSTPCHKNPKGSKAQYFPLSQVVRDVRCSKKHCLVLFGDRTCFTSKAFKTQFLHTIQVPSNIQKMYLPIGRFRLKSYATPILVLFKENKPIDIHMGVFYAKDKIGLTFNQKIINNILARNGLIPQTNVNLIWKDTKRKYIEKKKRMSRRSISFSDIPNTILRNKAMDFMIISSVNFENSDFSNASLKRTIFAHVNLKGAHMGSADLTGSIWIDTICPNGKNSRQTGATCVHQNSHNHK